MESSFFHQMDWLNLDGYEKNGSKSAVKGGFLSRLTASQKLFTYMSTFYRELRLDY
ncbi:hypothetical protein EDC32_10543 [Laceyella sacchari]|nr:hypothetical protein EDC32_10543 [Laceyella sacchari]